MSIPEKAKVGDWKEYTVVCAKTIWHYETTSVLIDSVNEMINNGWQPLGGLVVYEDYTGSVLAYQAMVKD